MQENRTMNNLLSGNSNISSVLSSNPKIQALQTTLQQSLLYFKDLVLEFEQLHLESDSYKTQFIAQKEKCDSNNCSGSETLKKVVESKDQIILLVASTLTKLSETKDLSLVDEAFNILFGETNTLTNNVDNKCSIVTLQSPKAESNDSIAEEISFNDESLSEIDGTPTGRTSPIIPARKLKAVIGKPSDLRDKKKCPDNWGTPEKKTMKLIYPTPIRNKPGKLRQSRLSSNLFKVKQTNVVDLTCSPEYSGGIRSCGEPFVKKESMENEDTILPSPTSAPASLIIFKPKDSPVKFKKPNLSLKIKRENEIKLDIRNIENVPADDITNMEESINILNQLPKRPIKNHKKPSPTKQDEPIDEDATHCDTISSISLLHDNKVDEVFNEYSPTKRPLAENINIANTPPKSDHEPRVDKMAAVNVKKKIPEFVETLYKEPTVRKKMEKRALPGWCCEECNNFFGALYKDDPEMMARKISECSKHRAPPRAPPPTNFWNPRWHVPEDTEELNRMNNAI